MRGSRTTRILAITLGLATATMGAAAALAHRDGGRPHGAFQLDRLEHGLTQLGLSDDVLQSAQAVITAARTEQDSLRDQIRAAHDQMRTALEAPSPSLDAVLASADTIGSLETQAQKNRLQAIVKVRQLLTPDQWQQLRAQSGGPAKHGRCHGTGAPDADA